MHASRAPRRFMAFDKHLNLVLGDSEELRKLPPKKGQDEVRAEFPCAAAQDARAYERVCSYA